MKVAILADLHGNPIALDRVLEDIQSTGGVDEYWLLGDYAAIGYDPVGTLERVSRLPGARFIRGNTDHYLCTGKLPGPQLADVVHNPSLARQHIQIVRGFAWTTGAVHATGWLPWLEALDLEMRLTLPDGTRVLAVHASPGSDDGPGIDHNITEEELAELVAGAEAELLFIGHTHVQFDRMVQDTRVINPGSISNPYPPDLRASYGILEVDGAGYQFTHKWVDFDREAVIQAVEEVKHPAGDYIARFMKGENKKSWMK